MEKKYGPSQKIIWYFFVYIIKEVLCIFLNKFMYSFYLIISAIYNFACGDQINKMKMWLLAVAILSKADTNGSN